MSAGSRVLGRVAGRGRHALHRLRLAAGGLRPVSATAMRLPADRRVPRPSEFARFGAGSYVVPPARIVGAGAIEIGAGVLVLEDAGLAVDEAGGARLVIGDGTRLAPGAEITCTRSISIGAHVSSSDYVSISDTWVSLARPTGGLPPPEGAPVVIEDGAYLGWGCAITPGVTVGAGAFVGEGSVVLDDVAPHTVVYGNPARVVRQLDPASRRWEGARFP